jgi:hypothetical protein
MIGPLDAPERKVGLAGILDNEAIGLFVDGKFNGDPVIESEFGLNCLVHLLCCACKGAQYICRRGRTSLQVHQHLLLLGCGFGLLSLLIDRRAGERGMRLATFV